MENLIDINLKIYRDNNKPYAHYQLEIDDKTKLVEFTLALYELDKLKEEIKKEADQIEPLMHAEETKNNKD